MPAPSPAPERTSLLPLLPEGRIGAVERIEPIRLGLSGAGVYAVTTARGAFVLRVQSRETDQTYFAQQLRVLRRAADAGVAPQVLHVDAQALAVVSAHVAGVPLQTALADPAQRGAVLGSVVALLRKLHALDAEGVAARDPLAYVRGVWEAGRARPGFPPWAAALSPTLERLAAILADDPRLCVSHNDLNPGNIMWDGGRAWLVDWEVTGLGHPYYDLATLALFLRLEDDAAFELTARHDGAPLDARSRASFRALRQLAGMGCGLTLLSLVDDLRVWPAPTPAQAPSLTDCYEGMRNGTLDLQRPEGRASFGLALLAVAVAGHRPP